jgi:hypothetical protein
MRSKHLVAARSCLKSKNTRLENQAERQFSADHLACSQPLLTVRAASPRSKRSNERMYSF